MPSSMPSMPVSSPEPANALGFAHIPYLGDTIPLLTNTLVYIEQRRRAYGDIWRTEFMGQRAAVAIGAEAQRQVLDDNHKFPAAPGYQFVKPVLGHSLFDMDGDEHETQRGFLTPAFSPRRYTRFVERIDRALQHVFDAWGDAGERVFYRDALSALFAVSCAVTLGLDRGPAYDHLVTRWQTMQHGLLNPIRIRIWGTPWHATLAARDYIIQTFLRDLIEQRHRAPVEDEAQGDMLDLLLLAQRTHPQALSDKQIIEHLMLMLFAGYDTTAGAISWIVLELLRHPEARARVLAEVHADAGEPNDAPIQLSDIRATPYFDAFIKETLRLHPAQHLSIRGVTSPWEYAGHTVPAGWSVLIAPIYTHRMPDYFADPLQFDPDRFLEPRSEDRTHPRALIEFGGGAHACLGSGVAKL